MCELPLKKGEYKQVYGFGSTSRWDSSECASSTSVITLLRCNLSAL
jgi:hypothetical protein